MKILYETSESSPWIASGGLGDVAGSLPKAISQFGIQCCVVLPFYSKIDENLRPLIEYVTHFDLAFDGGIQYCGIFTAYYNDVRYYFIDNMHFFARENIYGYLDDNRRFGFFCKAVLEMLLHIDFAPDIIHCNDWQTGLIPVFLDVFFREIEKFTTIKTLFTIHNIAYQGNFDFYHCDQFLRLPDYANDWITWNGCVNYMKAAITRSNQVNTVSNRYAQEIQYSWFGCGLDTLLSENKEKLSGILNGIDTVHYNPYTDCYLASPLEKDILDYKNANKTKLQQQFGLEEGQDKLIISIVSRLVAAKGMDLVIHVLEELLNTHWHIQIVLLGCGDFVYEQFFRELQMRFPSRVGIKFGFIPKLSTPVYAGSDLLLMPSLSEPCGLSQMIALRYGTIPVVHLTGGLADSIRDVGEVDGNGYTFQRINAHDMLNSILRAEKDFHNKNLWYARVAHALQCNFSWNYSANAYKQLYDSMLF
ncbi:MAG: glycogen synthase [Oscillospiraceae bacterium]